MLQTLSLNMILTLSLKEHVNNTLLMKNVWKQTSNYATSQVEKELEVWEWVSDKVKNK